MKEVRQHAFNQDFLEKDSVHTLDPSDPSIMELKELQGLVEELLAHSAINPFHIKLNDHETPLIGSL